MFKVKEIKVGTYDEFYKKNIQLQFLNDEKFTEFMKYLSTSSTNYQQVLKDYCEQFNLDTQQTEPSRAVLNSIGGLLGLPPIEYFSVEIDNVQTEITEQDYIMLIKGQQLKNTWDGTNQGIVNSLSVLFPEYNWSIYDTGVMNITINMVGSNISQTAQQLFSSGWFTPKPAGVGVTYNVIDFDLFTWDSATEEEKWDNGNWI